MAFKLVDRYKKYFNFCDNISALIFTLTFINLKSTINCFESAFIVLSSKIYVNTKKYEIYSIINFFLNA